MKIAKRHWHTDWLMFGKTQFSKQLISSNYIYFGYNYPSSVVSHWSESKIFLLGASLIMVSIYVTNLYFSCSIFRIFSCSILRIFSGPLRIFIAIYYLSKKSYYLPWNLANYGLIMVTNLHFCCSILRIFSGPFRIFLAIY